MDSCSGYHSVASVSLSSFTKGKCGTGSVDDCPGTVCGSVGDFGRTGDLETGGSEAGSGYSVILVLCLGGCSICAGESPFCFCPLTGVLSADFGIGIAGVGAGRDLGAAGMKCGDTCSCFRDLSFGGCSISGGISELFLVPFGVAMSNTCGSGGIIGFGLGE